LTAVLLMIYILGGARENMGHGDLVVLSRSSRS
jgi:hypothetical protein